MVQDHCLQEGWIHTMVALWIRSLIHDDAVVGVGIEVGRTAEVHPLATEGMKVGIMTETTVTEEIEVTAEAGVDLVAIVVDGIGEIGIGGTGIVTGTAGVVDVVVAEEAQEDHLVIVVAGAEVSA